MIQGMSAPPKRWRVTEEEFLAIPVSHDHIELIDGEVVLSPSPNLLHQQVVLRLGSSFDAWARAHAPARAAISPLDVRLGPERILQPDVCLWVRGLESTTMPIATLPDLLVEVLSNDVKYDRVTKRLLYFEAGVREYWVVDPLDRTVEVIQGLETVATHSDRVRSTVAEGLQIEIADLFV